MKTKQIPKFPSWFSPHAHNKPYVGQEPSKTVSRKTDQTQIKIYEYEELPIKEGYSYSIEVYVDYDGDKEIYLNQYKKQEIPNPHYNTQMKNFEQSKKMAEEWEELIKLWPEYEKQEKEKEELKLYEKLKQKYEG